MFSDEIDKLVLTNTNLKKEIEKNQAMISRRLHEEKREAHYLRNNVEPKLWQTENDKIMLFERLDSKDR